MVNIVEKVIQRAEVLVPEKLRFCSGEVTVGGWLHWLSCLARPVLVVNDSPLDDSHILDEESRCEPCVTRAVRVVTSTYLWTPASTTAVNVNAHRANGAVFILQHAAVFEGSLFHNG